MEQRTLHSTLVFRYPFSIKQGDTSTICGLLNFESQEAPQQHLPWRIPCWPSSSGWSIQALPHNPSRSKQARVSTLVGISAPKKKKITPSPNFPANILLAPHPPAPTRPGDPPPSWDFQKKNAPPPPPQTPPSPPPSRKRLEISKTSTKLL